MRKVYKGDAMELDEFHKNYNIYKKLLIILIYYCILKTQ